MILERKIQYNEKQGQYRILERHKFLCFKWWEEAEVRYALSDIGIPLRFSSYKEAERSLEELEECVPSKEEDWIDVEE